MYIFGNWLVTKFPKLKSYKPGIEFLSRLFFLLFLAFVAKKIYWLLSDKAGTFQWLPFGSFNPIETLRQSLIEATKLGISFLGYPPFSSGWTVGILPHQGAVSVQTPCLGINVSLAFIGLVLAYPTPLAWWRKLLFLILGVLVIQGVNVLRMIGMVFVVKNKYHLPIEHHDLFNIVVYAVIFGLFYVFINSIPKSAEE